MKRPCKTMSLLARDGHLAEQDGAGANIAARIHVVAHRNDAREHVAQVAGDGDFLDRPRDLAVLDPEARGTPRIIASHAVDALAHEFGDHESALHAPA